MKRLLFLWLALCLPASNAGGREPVVAGRFYPGDRAELSKAVDSYLAAGEKLKKPEGRVTAVLVPHAGYVYSGKLAGMAFHFIEDNYDTVVVLATGHTEGVKGAALLAGDFHKTPLGKVLPDRKLAAKLAKASALFEDRPSAHLREHAVEVELPFLQRRLKKPFRLLAAVMNTSDLEEARAVGRALGKALKGRKALLVISADLSHYPSRADAAAADGAVKLAVESMDPSLLWHTTRFILAKKVPGLDTCACGEAAMIAGMEAARALGARSFRALKLSNSYDEYPAGDPGRVVGYLSGLFLSSGKPADLSLTPALEHKLLEEARLTIKRQFAGEDQPRGLDPEPRLNLPGAAFVTLTKNGALRGCIGTVIPGMTLMDAVRYGAYSAAFRDTRFPALREEELKDVKIEISLLSPMKESRPGEIKPRRHGVMVRRGGSSGLFLPQVWEQIPDKEDFMGELCEQKARLPRGCWKEKGTDLYTFTADAFEEEEKRAAKQPASAPAAAAAER